MLFPSDFNFFISSIFDSLRLGRPPTRPCNLDFANPALTLSLIRSLSCFAKVDNNAIITFQTGSNEFEIWGLPFFTESCKSEFDKAVTEVFNH